MILKSALVLLAASAFQVTAPEPTKASVLPPDCGLTEERIIELAVPDYSTRTAQSNAHQHDGINEYWFHAEVVAVVTTDLGFVGRSFLLAAVSMRSGYCDGCYDAALVAVDLRNKRRVGRYESNSGECYIDPSTFPESDKPILRVFRVFPGDSVQTLAFRFGSEDPFHGEGATNEKWLRPSLARDGSLNFEAIWEATISFGTSGVASFTWPHEMTSTMTSLWPRRAYRFTTRTVAGWDDIALVAIQEFAQDQKGHTLVGGPRRFVHLERKGASTFPFNIRVASLNLDEAVLASALPFRPEGPMLSPAGSMIADVVGGDWYKPAHLRLCRSMGGAQFRDVWSGKPKLENDGLRFGPLGWTLDGSRCLAVVHLGLHGIPPVLVSVTPDGNGDRWEGFLPEGYQLPDGFILDLPEPPAKPTKHSTKP